MEAKIRGGGMTEAAEAIEHVKRIVAKADAVLAEINVLDDEMRAAVHAGVIGTLRGMFYVSSHQFCVGNNLSGADASTLLAAFTRMEMAAAEDVARAGGVILKHDIVTTVREKLSTTPPSKI